MDKRRVQKIIMDESYFLVINTCRRQNILMFGKRNENHFGNLQLRIFWKAIWSIYHSRFVNFMNNVVHMYIKCIYNMRCTLHLKTWFLLHVMILTIWTHDVEQTTYFSTKLKGLSWVVLKICQPQVFEKVHLHHLELPFLGVRKFVCWGFFGF